jgi:hydrogenase maturation protease
MSNQPEANPKAELLVIGYGNTLRRDDGVGPKVVEAVEALHLPRVQTLACHQLTPELIEPISHAHNVVFVDADTRTGGAAALHPIEAAAAGQILAHATDPRSLLALSKQLSGVAPRAWVLAIPVEDLNFGDGLSPLARAGLAAALEEIKALAQRLGES